MIKHLKYFRYILRHKYFVARACIERGLYWQALIHDLSKFLPSEWFPYVEYFYGRILDPAFDYEELRERGDKFDVAWLLHIHRNPHHWQHWILRNDDGSITYLEMPEKYVIEMLCDWEGAGLAINGKNDLVQWYEDNKNYIRLHTRTRELVERRLRPIVPRLVNESQPQVVN